MWYNVVMKIRENVLISELTTMRLGGPARFVLEVESKEDVAEAFKFAEEKGLPVWMMGGGANTLGHDEGCPGVVIINKLRGIEIVDESDGEIMFPVMAIHKYFRDNYDVILIENNMQVFEDIYNHAKNGTNHMIYHMHNDIDGTTKPEYLCKFIADKAEVILPVSEYLKEHFMQVAPNDKMKVFYNCVDLEKFNKENVSNTEVLKRKYNISESDFVYMYTGRVCPEKGILELVKAFKKLSRENPNCKLMVVGSRWYNQIAKDEYFEKLLKEAEGLEEKIIFTGYIFPEDMPSIYTVADVLVIPSMWEEPFGVVALEGMAMRVPIITTNSGGLIEILDAETSIIVDKNTEVEEQLYSAMIKMREDDDIRENLAQKAYTKLTETFAFDRKNYYDEFEKRIAKCK